MAVAIFDNATYRPIHPSGFRAERPTVVVAMAGGGVEQRAAILSRKLLTYRLRWRGRSTLRTYLETFFEARGYVAESFFWKDMDDFSRVAVPLGTGGGGATQFTLPLTGQYGGDYPLAPFQLYDDGSPAAGSVNTELRRFTFNVAPANGHALTVDYHYYRRVRLEAPFEWTHAPYGTWSTEFSLVEVPQT